jgi:hypothetical protein
MVRCRSGSARATIGDRGLCFADARFDVSADVRPLENRSAEEGNPIRQALILADAREDAALVPTFCQVRHCRELVAPLEAKA